MRRLITALTLCSLLVAPNAVAESDTPPLVGEYRLVGGKKKARARVDARIEEVIAEMSFITRPIARSKLRDSSLICADFGFTVGGGEISTRCEAIRTDTSPANGAAIETEFNGDDYVLRQTLVSPTKIRQHWTGDDGTRASVFALDDSGDRMVMRTTITSDQLPRPVVYELVYTRR